MACWWPSPGQQGPKNPGAVRQYKSAYLRHTSGTHLGCRRPLGSLSVTDCIHISHIWAACWWPAGCQKSPTSNDCIVFYTCLSGFLVTNWTPKESNKQRLYYILHVSEQLVGDRLHTKKGPTSNDCIVFYTYLSGLLVTDCIPKRVQQVTIVSYFTRI